MANQIYPAWGMWLKDRESVLQWVNLHSNWAALISGESNHE
ncbi:hypothetical protein AZ029_004908 [Klebsiella pneumoniae]|jgi:hypothetical protein|nr:hypothetical protein AZ029_004908 [Klebsiella pneumoniae]SWP98599.1 Uncharacterised protein [Klebsiella pneumoniae]VVK72871.1 Uncharacterised protein [Klebsiella pneumoniae]VVL03625.1 Uncharacterised protein [Klebsiella pneumoniae]